MIRLGDIARNDIRLFIHDITKHTIYTLLVVGASSLITYILMGRLVQKQLSSFTSTLKPTLQGGLLNFGSISSEEAYVERGSPYDNRTIEGASMSASVIFHGPRDGKKVALTFDAEMTEGMKAALTAGTVKSSYDKRIVDTLISTNTKATLFLTGMWIELYPDVTRELSKNSLFELGSHSYSDTSYHGFCYGLKQIPSTLRIEEVGATEKLLRNYAGIDNRLFRFPGGCYTPDDVMLVNQADDIVVHWDVAGADGFNMNTNQVVHNVIDNVQNGSIIILHMNGAPTAPKTADALPQIISNLKDRGYEFVKVTELLHLPPISHVQPQ